MLEQIYSFKTANFTLEVNALEEHDLDLSFDDTGDVRAKLSTGEYVAFCAQCVIYKNDNNLIELASTYLGGCIYESYSDFRDNVGLNIKSRKDGHNYGSYFSDMITEACSEARETLQNIKQLELKTT